MRERTSIALTLATLTLIACRVTPSRNVSASLEFATKNAIAGSEIKLLPLTDFAWSSFVAFGPYTTRQTAEQVLGFQWPSFDAFHLDSSDGFTLLVFLDGDRVVRVEELSRCAPDFSPAALGRRLSPAEAVFTVRKEADCSVLDVRSAV